MKYNELVDNVQNEYGAPFWSVVDSYAKDGESMSATGLILGFKTRSAFIHYVKKNNKRHLFKLPPQQTNGFKSARASDNNRINVSNGLIAYYSNRDEMRAHQP